MWSISNERDQEKIIMVSCRDETRNKVISIIVFYGNGRNKRKKILFIFQQVEELDVQTERMIK